MRDLNTPRLRLRQLTLDDTRFILNITNTPEWIQFIGDRNLKTDEDAKAYLLGGPIHNYMVAGYGFQLVELKETGQAIGMCGLVKRDSLEHVDLGFAFFSEFFGKGLAREASEAVIEFAQKDLGLKKLQAITVPENERSINLLERLGFAKSGEVILPKETVTLLVFDKAI